MDIKWKTCCITGHRDVPADVAPVILKRTEKVIRDLVKRGVIYYGVGGAVGYDTLVARLLFRLRQELPQIKVILVYPYEGYTRRWSADQQREAEELFPQYDKTVCASRSATKGAYLIRDRHLVDGSSVCISYCTKNHGGTAYTVGYAQGLGMEVINVAASKSTYW